MNSRKYAYLALTFISRFGDTVFLAGIPLYLFVAGEQKIVDTTFVNLAITITIILGSRLIIDLSQRNPLLITGLGEIAMGLVEILLILTLIMFGINKWIIIAFTVPLALLYNIYAPSKFFCLQDYFFESKRFYYTSVQSTVSHLGILTGIAISGVLVEYVGIYGILGIDAFTFLLYGFAITSFYKKGLMPDIVEKQEEVKNQILNAINGKYVVLIIMVLLSAVAFFQSWGQASAIAVTIKATGWSVVEAGNNKALYSMLGLFIGLIASWYNQRLSLLIWGLAILVMFPGLIIVGRAQQLLAVKLLLISIGVLTALTVSIQRMLFRHLENTRGDFEKLNALQWIYESVLCLFVTPVGYMIDTQISNGLVLIQYVSLLLGIVGIVGGILVATMVVRKSGYQVLKIAGLAMLVIACTSCRASSPYVTAVLGNPPASLNPAGVSEINEATILSQICGRLITIDEYLNIEGDLAEEWRVSRDQRMYEFKLNQDRKFVDGTKVTSKDVLFTLERIANIKSSYTAEWVREVKRVEAPDDATVKIELTNGDPRFLFKLSHPRFCVLKKEKPFIEVDGMQMPNSCGAYFVKNVSPEKREYSLEVNQNRINEVNEKRIVVRFLEQIEAIREFIAGRLHDLSFYLLDDGEQEQVRGISKTIKAKIYWTWALMLNPQKKPFTSLSSRRKFVSHFDKAAFLENWGSSMKESNSIVPYGMKGYTNAMDISGNYQTNHMLPGRCRGNIRVAVIRGMPNESTLKKSLRDVILSATKCPVEIEMLEMGSYVKALASASYEIYLHGLDTNTNDPLGFFRDFLSTSPENLLDIKNSEFDRVYLSLYSTPQDLRHQDDYDMLYKIVASQAVIIPLGHPEFEFFYDKGVKKIHMNPLGMHYNQWSKIGRNAK